jgi:flagella basal body P-ring formation protein FlgA
MVTVLATLLAMPSGNPVVAAETLLRERLEHRYPRVVRWEVEPLARGRSASATEVVELEILTVGARSAVRVKAASRRPTTIWYSVRGLAPVLTAARALPARAPIDAADVIATERDVVSLPCAVLPPDAQTSGMRMRTSRAAGEPLCAEHLEPMPAVARGEIVTVQYVSERVTVARRAIAQRDGEIGQRILVRGTDGGVPFRARVSGAGEVVVHD